MNLAHRIRDFIASLRVPLTHLRGVARHSGHQVSIVCATGDKSASYIANLLLKPGYERESLGHSWIWTVTGCAKRRAPHAQLLLVEVGGRKLSLFDRECFRIPVWVKSEIHLPVPQRLSKRKTYREDARKIQEAGFHYEVSSDPEQLTGFYHDMYVPLVSRSHGASAVVRSSSNLFAGPTSYELLLVKQKDAVVAGLVISYEPDAPRLHMLGVLGGDRHLIKQGALVACYFFALEHLQNAGYQKINAGSSRAFINDGVLTYKRKFGQRLAGHYPVYFVLKIMRHNDQTNALLQGLPVVCEMEGELHSLVFTDTEQLAELQRSPRKRSRFFIEGTVSLTACVLDGSDRQENAGTVAVKRQSPGSNLPLVVLERAI